MRLRRTLRALFPIAILLAFAACGDAGERSEAAPAGEAAAPAEPAEPRNPFGLEDVPDCCGDKTRAFAEQARELGAADDENAAQWSSVPAGTDDSIDGEWAGRWKIDAKGQDWVTGTATFRTVGDRVYIHYRDGGEYLVEAERQGDRLVGAYININEVTDRSPWVGRIVGPDRIDGAYAAGRWDFRRGGAADPAS